jgi:hypothetical protein
LLFVIIADEYHMADLCEDTNYDRADCFVDAAEDHEQRSRVMIIVFDEFSQTKGKFSWWPLLHGGQVRFLLELLLVDLVTFGATRMRQ